MLKGVLHRPFGIDLMKKHLACVVKIHTAISTAQPNAVYKNMRLPPAPGCQPYRTELNVGVKKFSAMAVNDRTSAFQTKTAGSLPLKRRRVSVKKRDGKR